MDIFVNEMNIDLTSHYTQKITKTYKSKCKRLSYYTSKSVYNKIYMALVSPQVLKMDPQKRKTM